MMTREEKLERIKELERQYFILNMKDNWDDADFERARDIRGELKGLREEV